MAVNILVNNNGKLDCHTCDDKLMEERGHDREGIVPFMVDGERVFRCPLTFITPLSWELIKAFGFYEKNILPNGNGFNNESKKYIQAMSVLDNEYTKQRNSQLNKSKG